MFLGTKKAGAIVYLDHLSDKTGVRAALIKAFSESTDAKLRNATKFANFIETVLYSMLISGENTLDSLPKFCSEYVLATGVLGNKTTLLKYINQIDEVFVEKFHQNFIQEYLKNNSDSYKALKSGLMVFATSTEIDNALHSQLNISSFAMLIRAYYQFAMKWVAPALAQALAQAPLAVIPISHYP